MGKIATEYIAANKWQDFSHIRFKYSNKFDKEPSISALEPNNCVLIMVQIS